MHWNMNRVTQRIERGCSPLKSTHGSSIWMQQRQMDRYKQSGNTTQKQTDWKFREKQTANSRQKNLMKQNVNAMDMMDFGVRFTSYSVTEESIRTANFLSNSLSSSGIQSGNSRIQFHFPSSSKMGSIIALNSIFINCRSNGKRCNSIRSAKLRAKESPHSITASKWIESQFLKIHENAFILESECWLSIHRYFKKGNSNCTLMAP